jgi:restriction endonuclease S subunit
MDYLMMIKNRLTELASIRTGFQTGGKLEETVYGDYMVVQTKDVNNDAIIDYNNLARIDIKNVAASHLLQKGDLLFINRGRKSTTCIVSQNLPNLICTPHFFVIRINEDKDEIDREFIAWQMNQKLAMNYFSKHQQGSSQVSVTKKALQNITLSIPNPDIQKQLVLMHRTFIDEKDTLSQLIENRKLQVESIAVKILGES